MKQLLEGHRELCIYSLKVFKVSLEDNVETWVEAGDKTKWSLRGRYGLGWKAGKNSQRTPKKAQYPYEKQTEMPGFYIRRSPKH